MSGGMSDTVLILKPLRAEGRDLLRARPGTRVIGLDVPTPDETAALLTGADALCVKNTPVTEAMLDAAPRLRVVSKHGVGLDNLPMDALTARGIPVATVGDANAASVAEHAVLLMLGLARRVVQYDARTRSGGYIADPDWPTRDLDGQRLLLVGVGRIGARVARVALALGMVVAAHDPFAASLPEGVEREDDLAAALGRADAVSLHCPLTPDTRHLIDAAALERMKPGAMLVNTGRGELVDEAALLAALEAGHLAGAGLDVFEVEPPDPANPLFARGDVLLSPHSAALTEEGAVRMARRTALNAIAGLDGTLDPAFVANATELGMA